MHQRQPKSIAMGYLSNHSKKALTQLALEGIVPSDDLMADMELLDSGRLTPEEYKQRAIARATTKA